MELKIINNKGQEQGTVQFNDAIFGVTGSNAVLHEVVVAYRAALRAGTHDTRTRAQVSGGGIKPWKQKGTGRARSGSTRSPLWRHGGIIFGPVPRDYSLTIPKKKRQLAFRMAVKSLIEDNRFQVVEPIEISESKTKHVASVYAKWKAPANSIFILDKIDAKFQRAARNIADVSLTDANSINTYDCLRARRVFITPAALEILNQRLFDSSEN